MILERILSLKQILAEERGGPIELHELGLCYFHLNNYKKAAEYFRDLLSRFPDYVEAGAVAALHAYTLVRTWEFASARKIIKERLKVSPHDTSLLGMLAFIEEKSGSVDEAIGLHRQILELDGQNTNSLNSLGYLLAMHGLPEDRPEAFLCLKRALEQKPGHPAYLDSLGMLLFQDGQKEKALRAMEEALRRIPDHPEILDHLRVVMDHP